MPTPAPTALPTDQDPRWPRILARDPTADGQFWYSVITTRIYCRPSCPSRSANAAHVRLHASLAEAQATGYRACRRCHPDGLSIAEAQAALIAKACRLIETAEAEPSLGELADTVELSPSHFHRLFRKVTGLTPKAYAAAHRADRLRRALGEAPTVTAAIYEAGFNAGSRFYEKSDQVLGMTPRRYRAGGAAETLRFAVGQCSLGAVLVASSTRGVVAIRFGEDPDVLVRALEDQFPEAVLIGGDTDYEALVAHVVGLVEAPGLGSDLPLDIRGTAFQARVWQALRAIPPGRTASYAEIAASIGAPAAVRAVAGACAANPLAVAIPCHRVVRADGTLGGYRWGIERKRALLAREAASETPRPSRADRVATEAAPAAPADR